MDSGRRYDWLVGQATRLDSGLLFPRVSKEATSCPPAPGVQSRRKGVE